jgi:hypothetical protein
MPSQLHEVLVMLFRSCPTLAPELLHTRIELPTFTEARVESADLSEVQPAEYRGDLVVVLRHEARPGEAKGEAKGRVAVLLKQLAVKNLGPLDAQTLARIQSGTLEELETWAVRVLDATSLADVFDA